MKKTFYALFGAITYLMVVPPVFAVGTDMSNYTNDTLQLITLLASASAAFFLIKGGYHYMTSTGHPEALENAKKTIRNAVIGLALVLGANVVISLLQGALLSPTASTTTQALTLSPLATQTPNDGVAQVLINAVIGLLQDVVQSATQPIVNAIISYLTTTPSLLTNSVVFHFWAISLGIVDSLFVVVVALLGLHFMSASTFGFEEIELKHLLPRIGLSFLGANVSLFLCDYVITTCNALVKEVINTTGGLDHAWVVNAINPVSLLTGNTKLITLIFFVIFLIVAIILLFMYIVRLILVALAGVLSPFIFLMWAIPKTSDFAEAAVKGYVVTVFMIFVHVVVIQLASSFLALPDNPDSSLLSIVIAIGLFLTLLRIPTWMFQMMFYTSRLSALIHMGSQMVNTMTTHKQEGSNAGYTEDDNAEAKLKRRYINA